MFGHSMGVEKERRSIRSGFERPCSFASAFNMIAGPVTSLRDRKFGPWIVDTSHVARALELCLQRGLRPGNG